jgi:hypothetical protein
MRGSFLESEQTFPPLPTAWRLPTTIQQPRPLCLHGPHAAGTFEIHEGRAEYRSIRHQGACCLAVRLSEQSLTPAFGPPFSAGLDSGPHRRVGGLVQKYVDLPPRLARQLQGFKVRM